MVDVWKSYNARRNSGSGEVMGSVKEAISGLSKSLAISYCMVRLLLARCLARN